jgi:hypothetical protein
MNLEETDMNSLSKTAPKTTAHVALQWDACYEPHQHRTLKQAENAFAVLVIAVLFGLFLIVVNARPVHSQGVQLVKVDVAVIAKGYRVSKLIGSGVTNDKNEKIGTIDDIVVSRDKLLFAVLQVGGFLGLGGRLVAVPYASLNIDETGKKIELPGASKDELRKLAEVQYGA